MGRRRNKHNITTKQAFDRLQRALKDDPNYAYSWHCNIAMCAIDLGVSRQVGNKAATNFMKLAFGVDTK